MPARLAAPADLCVVTIDTMRADRAGCYGFAAPTTPTLDRLSRSASIYTEARTTAPLTLPAHASLFTGELPSEHGVRNNGFYRLPERAVTLAEQLRDRGVLTAAFVSSYVLQRGSGIGQGFDVFDGVEGLHAGTAPETEFDERPGHATVEAAISWLRGTAGRRPRFLWVHLYEPHVPYRPPAPYERLGEYEGEIATADHELGRLLRALGTASSEVWVAADHGEALGAHGELTHGTFLYDETLRVPLVGKTAAPPAIVTRQISLAEVRGLIARDGGAAPASRTHAAECLAPMLDLGWSPLHAWIEDGRKLVRAPTPELYDLGSDPGEHHNVHDANPAVARAMEAKLAAVAQRESDARAPVSEEERKRLESLGYLGGVGGGSAAARAPGRDPKEMVDVLPLLGGQGVELEKNIEALLARDPGNSWDASGKAGSSSHGARRPMLRRSSHRCVTRARSARRRCRGSPRAGTSSKTGPGQGLFALALEQDPADAAIAFNMGQLDLFLGRTAEAISELARALDDPALGPDAAAAIWTATRRGAPAAGAPWRVEDEIDPSLLRAVAAAARKAGDEPVARELEERARAVELLDGKGLLARASRASPEEARALLERAVRLSPGDDGVRLEAALANARGGRMDRARELRAGLDPRGLPPSLRPKLTELDRLLPGR
ncbi:MAG: sulfatase-like hydrolase/transferase [Acidobacteriota bacterium]